MLLIHLLTLMDFHLLCKQWRQWNNPLQKLHHCISTWYINFCCSFQWTHSKVISDLKKCNSRKELEQKKHHMKGPKKLFQKWSFLVFNFIEGNCTFGKMWISFRARFSAYLSKKSNIVSKQWEYFLQKVLAPLQIW